MGTNRPTFTQALEEILYLYECREFGEQAWLVEALTDYHAALTAYQTRRCGDAPCREEWVKAWLESQHPHLHERKEERRFLEAHRSLRLFPEL